MKIAVCLSGQPRKFRTGYKFLSDSLNNYSVDYFFHLWFDESEAGKPLNIYSKEQQVLCDILEPDLDKKILDLYKPRKYIFEKQIVFEQDQELEFNHGRSSKSHQPSDIFQSMLYSRYKSGELMQEFASEYDLAVWVRTDVVTNGDFISEVVDDSIYTGYCRGPEWNTSCVTTGILVSTPKHVKHYLDLYNNYKGIFNKGIDYCDHRMSYAHLATLNKPFKFILKNNWYWVRANGLSPGFC